MLHPISINGKDRRSDLRLQAQIRIDIITSGFACRLRREVSESVQKLSHRSTRDAVSHRKTERRADAALRGVAYEVSELCPVMLWLASVS
jgi:hypothetical protein